MRNYLVVLVVLVCSCREQTTSLTGQQDILPTATIVETAQYSLPIDQSTGHLQSSYQYLTIKDTGYLTFLNKQTASIYVYDLDRKHLKQIIQLNKSATNSYGKSTQLAHFLVNLDSIIVFNYDAETLSFFTSEGKLTTKVLLIDSIQSKSRFTSFPIASTVQPITKVNNSIFLFSLGFDLVEDHSKVKVLYEVSLDSGKVTSHMPRPAFFQRGQWGIYKNSVYGCRTADGNGVLLGFGNSPDLFEIRNGEEFGRPRIKSIFIDSIYPLSKELLKTFDKKTTALYDFTTPSYRALFYDPFKIRYYRFVTARPFTEKEFLSNQQKRPQYSIIVFDTSLKVLGEAMIPEGRYEMDNVFITPKGINLTLVHQNFQDSIQFGVINFKL